MSNIIGTVIEIENFLSTDKQLIVTSERRTQYLDKNRKYIIPDFQREIRWSEEQIVELINNIGGGAKFLGNIILSETKRKNEDLQNELNESKDYEIIDGQQRITTLLIILRFIRYKYGEDLSINNDICSLEIQSFKGFSKLYEDAFSNDSANQKDIKETDDLNQIDHYLYMWNTICNYSRQNSSFLRNKDTCQKLLNNIMDSTINVIINTSEKISHGINLFLDVNLKGKKLDTEDVFKSYLFSYDDNNSTFRGQWVKIKKLSSKLIVKNHGRQQKNLYPLMDIIRHSFYCWLYKEKYWKNIEISQGFCLLRSVEISGDTETEKSHHYKGEHIIDVLKSNRLLKKVLNSVENFLIMATEVVNAEAPTQTFKDYFNVEDGNKVDSTTISIAHAFIKRILYDDTTLPKALLFKYFITTLDEKQDKRANYKWIFDVYAFNVLFDLSTIKKEKDIVLGIVAEKDETTDWHNELSSTIKAFLEKTDITPTKAIVQYKYADEKFNEEYLCKGLAVLYNYFSICNGRCSVKNENELKNFLYNNRTYSLEHLIINKSKNLSSGSMPLPAAEKSCALLSTAKRRPQKF